MTDPKSKVGESRKRQKTGGRTKGTPNKVTAMVKDAIITAAEKHGFDGKGKDNMVGYMMKLAAEQPTAFATLLGKVIPTQVEGTGEGGAINVTGLNIKFVSDGKDG